MNKNNYYYRQVELLLKILPFVAKEDCFALKGGTAINFFIRDLPRLSVDIDLAYLPLESRQISLENIESALLRIKKDLLSVFDSISVREKRTLSGNHLVKLFVSQQDVLIKIEPNDILRGSVFAHEKLDLAIKAQEQFQLSISDIQVLSVADLYGGKICAALSRQHPRDLFDIKLLLENEGINEAMRQAFIVYLASSPRPMHELLNPNPSLSDMRAVYEESFLGMTQIDTKYDDLKEIRQELPRLLLRSFSQNDKEFILSIKSGNPQWDLFPIPQISHLPALQWKLINIKKMDEEKRSLAFTELQKNSGMDIIFNIVIELFCQGSLETIVK